LTSAEESAALSAGTEATAVAEATGTEAAGVERFNLYRDTDIKLLHAATLREESELIPTESVLSD